MKEKIASVAGQFGASEYTMNRIIFCESGYKNIQSQIVSNGVQEESYGIVQIHLPSHPNITKDMALDIDFSIEFLAKELVAGNVWKWYGYNIKTDLCTNGMDQYAMGGR